MRTRWKSPKTKLYNEAMEVKFHPPTGTRQLYFYQHNPCGEPGAHILLCFPRTSMAAQDIQSSQSWGTEV